MNTSNVSPQPNIEQVRELLSPYLDNEVTATERQVVEQALQSSSELRADLESLRQTVTLLKAMPAMAAPRPFTLTAADMPAQQFTSRRSWFILPGWLTNLASMALLLGALVLSGILLFSPLNFSSKSPQMVAEAPKQAQEIAAAPTPEAAKAEVPKEEAVQKSAAAAPTEAVAAAKMAAKEEAPAANAAAANPNEPSARMGAAPAPAADAAVEQSAAALPPPVAAKEGATTLAEAPPSGSGEPGLMSAESATLQPAPMGMAATQAESKANEKEVITETVATESTETMTLATATITPTATLNPTPITPATPVSSQTVWLITGILVVLMFVGGIIGWLKQSGKL
jgi:hypothetical protein